MASDLDIVILNDFAYVEGGASQVALQSAMGLAARGHRVRLLAAVGPPMPELERNHVSVSYTGQSAIADDQDRFRAARQGIWNRQAAQVLRDMLRQVDPSRTVVHLHSWTKALSSSVVRVAYDRGVSVVCTLHDYFTACPNGGYFNYPLGTICELRGMSPACVASNCDKRSYAQKLWRVLRQWTQQRHGYIPDGVRSFIAPSQFAKDILSPSLPPSVPVEVIPNPVDSVRGEPSPVDANNRFVMIGRLSPEKGPTLFAKAAAVTGCEAVFLGDGECRDEVLANCPSAMVTGWVSRIQVGDMLRQARALVCPSVCYETQALVVSEAAAQGVPAIVSDRSAGRESVLDGETGLWFRNGDLDDLVAKVRMLQSPSLASRLGRAAYERYWADARTMDRHLGLVEALYQRVLHA